MPKPLDSVNTGAAPGNHPDAGPDNAIARNTAALGVLANEVIDHKAKMTRHTEAMSSHTGAMESHRDLMQASLDATQAATDTSRDSCDQMAALLAAIGALNTSVNNLADLLATHSKTSDDLRKTVAANTAAMRELKRI